MKPVYQQYVVERVVDATRDRVWASVIEWLGARGFDGGVDAGPGAVRRVPGEAGSAELVEEIISFEPPWRLVYRIVDGAPTELFQGFVHVVPDPAGCLVIRSFLALPGPDVVASQAFFARAQTALDAWPDRITAAVG